MGSFLLYSVHEGIRGIPLDPNDKSDALVPVSGTSLAVGIDFHAGEPFHNKGNYWGGVFLGSSERLAQPQKCWGCLLGAAPPCSSLTDLQGSPELTPSPPFLTPLMSHRISSCWRLHIVSLPPRKRHHLLGRHGPEHHQPGQARPDMA